MSLDGAYDDDNIFARIIRGELPCAKVYEDADTLAFMDAFPQTYGHALVVHKRSRARNLLDAEPETLNAVILTVQKLTRAMRGALRPDGIVVTQFNGAPAGQSIFHLHFHILPRWEDAPPRPHASGSRADPEALAALAAQIASQIQ